MSGIESCLASVASACRVLGQEKLVVLGEGNVSARFDNLVVIKGSGLMCSNVTERDLAVVDLHTGLAVSTAVRPSVDTPWHCALYRARRSITAIAHTHSVSASSFAQARRPIPVLGTTHADLFSGQIPVTDLPSRFTDFDSYSRAVVETLLAVYEDGLPATLLAGHGVVTFGHSRGPMEAAENALIIEKIAELAIKTFMVSSLLHGAPELPSMIAQVHYARKHGAHATYGQGDTA